MTHTSTWGKWLTRGALLALSTLLTGCLSPQPTPHQASVKKPAPLMPAVKVVDYLSVECDPLWSFTQADALNSPLYWLRATECAARLSPVDARATARQLSASDWAGSFKQGILLSNGNVTPMERRQYMSVVDNYSAAIPAPVRQVWLLWRDHQLAQLQLSEERSRYASLQETSDVQLDALRQQQIHLTQELNVTRRKLENLTDIERQLSNRKSAADISDTSHGPDKAPANSVAPQESGASAEEGANP
ncbi:two-component system QseEF-associated lipoprotein QseG [Enterobacterales bacterium CwR94]|nr:two-component system QseEF-associated lipoprotein QseG [Enterobacterales bacterium CwR94]